MRLDVKVSEISSLSREKSKEMIEKGNITVNGKTVVKPSYGVGDCDEIVILAKPDYVSRGGSKLEGALKIFGIDVSGLVCLDIGASTGGFTDCLLKNGAKKVYAVDVGTNQLAESLRKDSRVVSLEKTDIRDLAEKGLPEKADLSVCDVSFISLSHIFPSSSKLCDKGIFLIKPQFELDKSALDGHGVVKSEKDRAKAVEKVREYAKSSGYAEKGFALSPVKGKEGNTEYLIYLEKEER